MKKHLYIALATTVLFGACSQVPTQAENLNPPVSTTPPIPKEALNGQSLFQILLAEIAINRAEYGAAAALYGEIGANHPDVAAIERAVALNQNIGNYEKMHQLSERWVQLRPNDASALQARSLSSIGTGQIDLGIQTIDHWLSQDPNADVSLLIPGLQTLTAAELESVYTGLGNLEPQHPKSPSLFYTRSRLALAINQPEQALALANQSLAIQDNVQVKLFKFQLLLAKEDIKSASTLIQNLDKQHPEDRQVAIAYARFIYQFEPKNLSKLEVLNNRFATETTITRTYARAAFDQQDFDAAQAVFQHLLDQGFRDEAHYYLALIALENVMPDAAVDHFEAVTQPPYLASAMAEWAALGRLEDEQRFSTAIATAALNHPAQAPILYRIKANYFQRIDNNELARETLAKARAEFPDDIPLLYDEAMLAATQDRLDLMESNLIAILELDPNNINALNALGYSWVDANKNLELANTYIEKALADDPENAAYQDSKGWYLYRIGDYNGALGWLTKAYAQLENDEVAAHIAEVLWKMGRIDEAKKYQAEVKRLNPDSKFLGRLNELLAQ